MPEVGFISLVYQAEKEINKGPKILIDYDHFGAYRARMAKIANISEMSQLQMSANRMAGINRHLQQHSGVFSLGLNQWLNCR